MTFAEAGRVTEAKAIAQHLRNTFFEDGDFHAKDDPKSGGLKNYRTAWIGRGCINLGFSIFPTLRVLFLNQKWFQNIII